MCDINLYGKMRVWYAHDWNHKLQVFFRDVSNRSTVGGLTETIVSFCYLCLSIGHRYFKMKVGSADPEEDVSRARAIREEIGEGKAKKGESTAEDEVHVVCIDEALGPWEAIWLTVTPTEHGLSFLDAEYAVMVRFRLRLPFLHHFAVLIHIVVHLLLRRH